MLEYLAGLPAAFFPRFAFLRLRSGVRMLRTGRQRGVLWVQAQPRFKFRNPRFQLGDLRQQADDGLGFRRLAGDDFLRNFKRHATGVAENAPRVQIKLSRFRPQGVNGYELA